MPLAFRTPFDGTGKAPRDWEGTTPAIEGDHMPAPTTDIESAMLTRRRSALDNAQIETLFFLDLNAESDKPEPRERELPEELTGFYYTG
jgi:hypothetical protein